MGCGWEDAGSRAGPAAGTAQVRQPESLTPGSTPLLPSRPAPEEEPAAIRARLCRLLTRWLQLPAGKVAGMLPAGWDSVPSAGG